jgi:hypothetical protein
MDEAEQRWGERVPYAAYILVTHGERAWLAQTQDLSEGGCGIFRPVGFALEVAELARLHFLGRPGPVHVVGARVARAEATSIGFEYHEPQTVPPGGAATLDASVAPYL